MTGTGPGTAGALSATPESAQSTQSSGTADAHSRFAAVFDAYLAGEGDLAAVRREIVRHLYAGAESAAAIEWLLAVARDEGDLEPADYAVLAEDVQRMTTEESPTDTRVDAGAPLAPLREERVEDVDQEPDHAVCEPAPGSVLNDRYQLEELIADGPMGKVYRASDRVKRQAGANPAVAIKVLDPGRRTDAGARDQFRREAFHAQRLAHPNIINVFDLGRDGAVVFLTMEWLVGESLAALLDRTRPRPLRRSELRRIVAGVAAGLSYAHARGIVHGDIKPANIFLCEDGSVRLMDFGVVRGPATPESGEPAGAVAVTPGYASCELLEACEPCVQDDVYALACTIYRMAAGLRPYGRQTALQAESSGRVPDRPPGLTRRQWRTLRDALALRRADRSGSIEALTRAFATEPATLRRTGWLTAVIAALVLGFGAGIGLRVGSDTAQPGAEIGRDAVVEREPAGVAKSRGNGDGSPVGAPLPVADAPVEVESITITVPPVSREPDTSPAVAVAEPEIDPRPAPLRPTGFTARRYEAAEDDGVVRLVVRRPSAPTGASALRLTAESGSAVAGSDFAPPANGELAFPPGEAEATVFLPLIADAVPEHVEEFTVRLESSGPAGALDNAEALVIIVDDD